MRRWIVLLLALLIPLKSVAAPGILIAGPAGHAHAAGASHHTAHHDGHRASVHAHPDNPASESREAPAAPEADSTHAGCPMFAASGANPTDHAPHDHPCPHLGMASIAATIEVVAPVPLPHDRTILPAVRFASITLDVPSPPPTSILA